MNRIKQSIKDWLKKMYVNHINKLINRREFSKLTPTKKSIPELKKQSFLVEGKLMHSIAYINMVAELLPPTFNKHGEKVNHKANLKKYYYDFDIAGINYYKSMVTRLTQQANEAAKAS